MSCVTFGHLHPAALYIASASHETTMCIRVWVMVMVMVLNSDEQIAIDDILLLPLPIDPEYRFQRYSSAQNELRSGVVSRCSVTCKYRRSQV